MRAAVVSTSREKFEVYRFSLWAAVLVPLGALVAQSFLPARFPFFALFDLPLLVTVFFAVARRSPATGLLTGATLGLMQDALAHQPIGIFGIAKTVVGYAASSLGARIDVEHPFSRFGLTFGFYLAHQAVYALVTRGLIGETMAWRWGHMLVAAFANAAVAVPLFALLDRFKQRA